MGSFCKLILEEIYPDKFHDIVIDREKPDLRNSGSSIGVEVTSAEDKETRELDNLYTRQYCYGDSVSKARARKRIEELGGQIAKECLVHPFARRKVKNIYEIVKDKTRKLNSDYETFDENDLFIFDAFSVLDHELPEMLSKITINAEGKMSFGIVYLYYVGAGVLYEFNILNNTYRYHKLNSEDSNYRLATKARQIISERYIQN